MRPAAPWSSAVQALLGHVRARGLDRAPEPLGFDAQGREVVAYVEGDVHGYPLPAWLWSEAMLAATAALVRRYHDATEDFDAAGRRWQLPVHEPAQVVCHNDLGPYTFVFRGRELYGLIDFEAAAPGPRAWDLAYAAYRLVPLGALGNPDLRASTNGERAARLARFCECYGDDGPSPAEVLALVPDRLDALASWTAQQAGDDPAYADHARQYAADARYARAATGELA